MGIVERQSNRSFTLPRPVIGFGGWSSQARLTIQEDPIRLWANDVSIAIERTLTDLAEQSDAISDGSGILETAIIQNSNGSVKLDLGDSKLSISAENGIHVLAGGDIFFQSTSSDMALIIFENENEDQAYLGGYTTDVGGIDYIVFDPFSDGGANLGIGLLYSWDYVSIYALSSFEVAGGCDITLGGPTWATSFFALQEGTSTPAQGAGYLALQNYLTGGKQSLRIRWDDGSTTTLATQP